jgi:serine/threonine protein kinase
MVADFGNAIIKDMEQQYQSTGYTGTLAYTAPEVLVPHARHGANGTGVRCNVDLVPDDAYLSTSAPTSPSRNESPLPISASASASANTSGSFHHHSSSQNGSAPIDVNLSSLQYDEKVDTWSLGQVSNAHHLHLYMLMLTLTVVERQ